MTTEYSTEDPESTDSIQGEPDPVRRQMRILEKQNRDFARQLEGYQRKDAFEKAVKEAGVEGVSFEDLGEIPPKDITPALIIAKREEVLTKQKTLLADLAKQTGIEPDQFLINFNEFVESKKKERQQLVGASQAAGAGSAPPVTQQTKASELHRRYTAGEISHDEYMRILHTPGAVEFTGGLRPS